MNPQIARFFWQEKWKSPRNGPKIHPWNSPKNFSVLWNLSTEDQTNWPIEGGLTKDVDCKLSLGDHFSPPHIILVCETPHTEPSIFFDGQLEWLKTCCHFWWKKSRHQVDMVNVPLFPTGFRVTSKRWLGMGFLPIVVWIPSPPNPKSTHCKAEVLSILVIMEGGSWDFENSYGPHCWNCLFQKCFGEMVFAFLSIWVGWRDASKKVGLSREIFQTDLILRWWNTITPCKCLNLTEFFMKILYQCGLSCTFCSYI